MGGVIETCFGGNGKGGVTADIKFSVKPVGSFVAKSPVASELTLWTKDLKAVRAFLGLQNILRN